MTNALTLARAAVKDALTTGGMNAHVILPERVTPPLAWIAAGDPYITREGANFGGEIVHHEVVVAVGAGVNEVKAEGLDDLILKALDALDAADLHVSNVGQPGTVSIGGQKCLAVAIDVQTEIHR